MVLKEALRLAGLGLPVVAMYPQKKVPLRLEDLGLTHGLRDATCDPERIKAIWERFPGADLAGAPPAGIIVLDFDQEDSKNRFLRRFPQLRNAPLARTGGGGWHLWASTPEVFRVKSKVTADFQIDLRGMGRSLINLPPSKHPKGHYRWIRPLTGLKLTPIPEDLLEILRRECREPDPLPPLQIITGIGISATAYQRNKSLKELRGRCEEMAATPAGKRHHELIRHGQALVGRHRAGYLNESEITEALTAAARACGLPDNEIQRDIKWCFKESRVPPRVLPP